MLKNFLKDNFLITKLRPRFNPAVQISQRQLFHYYQDQVREGNSPALKDCGFRVFSQFEEDGKLLFIFAAIGMTHKTFIEIGSDDGVNSNSANLYFNFDWQGLFVDANPKSISRGEKFFSKYPHPWYSPPQFKLAKVNRKNINQIISDAGMGGEIGFLSIDIDGNDYWIWDAIEIVQPQVVMIETHVIFGLNDVVVPYDENYVYPGKHPSYHGASPIAMQKLGKKKGYRLVGANDMGFNFIFVKEGLAEKELPEVDCKDLLNHPATQASFSKFEEIKDWEYESF